MRDDPPNAADLAELIAALGRLSADLAALAETHASLSRSLEDLTRAIAISALGANAAIAPIGETVELPEPTEHRRNHRPGPPPKIDSDPELQAFITLELTE